MIHGIGFLLESPHKQPLNLFWVMRFAGEMQMQFLSFFIVAHEKEISLKMHHYRPI